MPDPEKVAEAVEKRMTFIQKFLEEKKYGWGILYFVLFAAGIIAAVMAYSKGTEFGEKNSKEEIKALNNSLINRNLELESSKKNTENYKLLYDDCNSKSNNLDLEDLVRRRLEESDRLERILEKKILTTEKQTKEINQILK